MVPSPRSKPAPLNQAEQDEQRQLAHVRDDLLREFAAVSPAVVEEKFSTVVSGFRTAPVRSFVPVLVRRSTREQLRLLA